MGYFPVKWELAQVLFLPKPDKEDYTDPSAYWRISLLRTWQNSRKNFTGKTARSGSHSKLAEKNQHGFRNGLSTITAIDLLKKDIQHGYHCKAYTACVLLYIKGAFDNARHDVIVRNLASKKCPSYLI